MHEGGGEVQVEGANTTTTCNERDKQQDRGRRHQEQGENDVEDVQVQHHAGTPWDRKRKWQQGSNTCITASVEAQGTHLGRISTFDCKGDRD